MVDIFIAFQLFPLDTIQDFSSQNEGYTSNVLVLLHVLRRTGDSILRLNESDSRSINIAHISDLYQHLP